jgi:5-methylcytosine-specific restriction endonuclease McrA
MPCKDPPVGSFSFCEENTMQRVLVLNASYEPLHVVSVKRALILLLKEKAELLEAAETSWRAETRFFPVPLVIRLVTYVRIPQRLHLPLNRRNVILRDNYACQYCGASASQVTLTLDHVLPRSRGGPTSWENVVAACTVCNQRKGDRLPDEAGMPLHRPPYRPRYLAIALLGEGTPRDVWGKYFS